ncbi:MAG: Gfo/Idh/MocA family oxidoreductase [Oscillospiraceae bacterium]|nr:Gfo/Idh/MocA family oxidoreductase [Oscillospiraceae bacterium]
MFKVGLIGAGFMGGMHVNCYKALSDKVEIAAIADVREDAAKALAEGTGAVVYTSADELLRHPDLDFVDICLPTYLHAEFTIKAMESGLNVFVEKPLCRTSEEAAKIVETQKKTGKIAQVGQVIRFWDEYVWLKEVTESGKYGKIKTATFKRFSSYPDWAAENWLHCFEKSGGMALDLHVHDIDFARYLMGEPKEVRASGLNDASGLSEYITTTYLYDGAIATCEGTWNYPKEFGLTMAYVVEFEKATAVFNSGTGKFCVYPKDGGVENVVLDKSFEGDSDIGGNISSLGGYYNELEYFTRRLADPTLSDIASLSEGARSVELALEGYLKV